MSSDLERLMIAIPTLDYVHRRFVESLTGLTKHLAESGVAFDIVYEGCTLVYISRDNLAKKAIEGDYDWVLWLDADMVFDEDIYDKLKETGKDFVTGLYMGRHGKNLPCVFNTIDPPNRKVSINWAKALEPIEGCGFGCVLIKTDILKDVFARYETCFRPVPKFGEDIAFCSRALERGYDIWQANNVLVGHIAQCIVHPREDKTML